MNRKLITSISVISLLNGCASYNACPMDNKVLNANSILYTLDMYDEYINGELDKSIKSKSEIQKSWNNKKGSMVSFCVISPLSIVFPRYL